jgi:hypothetical protein
MLASYEGARRFGVGVTVSAELGCTRPLFSARPASTGRLVGFIDGQAVYAERVTQVGDMAAQFVDPVLIRRMRKGKTLTIETDLGLIDVPLRGFSEAYKKAESACWKAKRGK